MLVLPVRRAIARDQAPLLRSLAARASRGAATLLFAVYAAACAAADATAPKTKPVDPSVPGAPARMDASVAEVGLNAVGASEQVSVTVRDAKGLVIPQASVLWTSSDITVADVAGSGTAAVITARAPGRTVVRAHLGVFVQDIVVTVSGARAITLAPSAATVRSGDRVTLVPTLDGNPNTKADLRWQSDDITVATVSATGEVLGVSQGTTNIRVSLMGDPRIAAVSQVTVTTARSVRITTASPSTFVGEKVQLTASLDVDSTQTQALTWSTDMPSIATVSANGEVTGVSAGTTLVRVASVADPRAKDTVTVRVSLPRTVTVSPNAVQLAAGETRFLNASVSIEEGLSRDVTWRSDNLGVAMVSSGGLVTGVGQGTATITATSIADTTRKGTAVISVIAVVRDFDLQPSALSMFMGDVRALTATIVADAGASRTVIWRSSNPTIASVDANGSVTAVNAGSAIITALAAADTTMRATALITVHTAIAVSVNPTSALLAPGATRAFSATVRADQGVSTAVTWRSADPTIATVNSGGVVTGVGAGTTQITAVSVADTTRRGTATVTIVPTVQSVTIAPGSAMIAPSESMQFSATVNGDVGVSQAVIWRTTDPAIAQVSGAGVVTGVAAGSTIITAISANDTTKRASAAVTVRNAPVVSVSPSVVQLDPGQSQQFTATVQADQGVNTGVSWSTSSAAVATVSANGLVTAVSYGSATITATSLADGSRRATATVTVNGAVQSVSVTPATVSLAIGGTTQLSATVQAQGNMPTTVTWRSSNPAVASVNVNGVVSAMAAGSATITAAATADTTKKASSAVTITNAPPPPPPPPNRLAVSWSASRLGGPLVEDVVSIDAVDNNTAFAVNSNGDVYRYASGAWSLAVSGASWNTQFQSVSASNTTNAIAVGTNGVIVRFNGSGWSALASGTTRTLHGVWVESVSSAYAVGDNGTVMRFDGTNWSTGVSGTTASITAVWASGGVATAVGADGEIIRYNGSWSRMASGTTEVLTGVSGVSASDMVAVGLQGTVLRYNGTSWSRVSVSGLSADIFGVAGGALSGGTMYLATDLGLMQLVGSTASTVATPYAPRMLAANLDNTGGVWVTGQRGSVLRGVSNVWSTINLAPDLIDVWTTSTTNAWAVGEFGFVYRWNGSAWTRQTTPTTGTLNAVWGASSTDAFAGGDNGVMLRWNGSSWATVAFPSSGHIYGIWGSAANSVWAVTSNGEIVRWNGSAWSVATTAGVPLYTIHGSAAGDIVASGANGTTLRYNGSSWTSFAISTSGFVAGVYAAGASEYFAVGSNASGNAGIAFFANGSSWSSMNVNSTRALTSIWGWMDSDVYATGEQGTILRYNGTTWSAMSSGTSDLLWSVSGAPDGSGGGFAVGYNSTVVAGTPGTGFMAGLRTGSTTTRGSGYSLEPRAGARVVRGALPEGSARKLRRSR